MTREPPRIPNPSGKRMHPELGSPAELESLNKIANAIMYAALNEFGPNNTGAAVAAMCAALGSTFAMLTNIKMFYGTPEAFADAVRSMVLDVASDTDRD